jgi:hypothetical protein
LGGRGRWISEFEDSQGYTEKPCLEKTSKQTNNNKSMLNHEIKKTGEAENPNASLISYLKLPN